MSGKAIKKIRKWYKKELQTEAFKNHDKVWQEINADMQKRLNLYRKALAVSFFLWIAMVVATIISMKILMG